MRSNGDRVTFLVVGTPRSGTTVVQRLALSLDAVAMPPETHFFTDLVPGLLQRRRLPLDREAARSEVDAFLQLPNSSGIRLDPGAVAMRIPATGGSVIDLFDAIVVELARPAALLGEKTPDHLLWWKPIVHARPDMRFVVVVRHPLDVIASNLHAPFRAEAIRHWGDDYFLAMAEHWVHHQCVARDLIRRDPSLAILLRYEDVVADPTSATLTLARFLERPLAQRKLGAAEVVLEWEHWKKASFDDIVPLSVGSWARRLSDQQVAQAAPLVRHLAARYGYEVPGPAKWWTDRGRAGRSLRRRLTHLRTGLRRQQAKIDASILS